MTTLAELTTFRVGGEVSRLVCATSSEELVAAVRAADEEQRQLLVLGGGSNLLASDDPFDGTVVAVRPGAEIARIVEEDAADSVIVRVWAGTVWDDFVAWSIDEHLSGIEALSGIPGSAGASPVQNVGAYGHEVAETIHSVEAYDRLERSSLSAPVMYSELARRLGVEAGERAEASLVRSTVLELRAGKGMVLNPEDHDTWSAGSFFTNPILPEAVAAALPEEAPRFPAGEGLVKTSAAWLIDHAGCSKGFHLPEAGDPPRASLSTKHVLALTNRGGASGADIEALARAVRERVFDAYGVTLVPEPVAIGIEW